MGVALFPFLLLRADLPFHFPECRCVLVSTEELHRVLMFSVSFFCVVSGSSDMRACRADNESVRKTAFLGFSSHEMMVSVAFSSARTSAL